MLLTDMVVEDFEMALQIRKRFTRRWDCETSVQFSQEQNRAGKICRKKIQKHAAVDIFGRFGNGFFELSTVTL